MNKSSKYFDYLIKVSKRMMDKKYKDRITEVVQRLEQNGGKVCDYQFFPCSAYFAWSRNYRIYALYLGGHFSVRYMYHEYTGINHYLYT